MAFGKGFQAKQAVMTAEFIREQRADIVKAFQSKVLSLKDQVAVLEARLKNITQEISKHFMEREKSIEYLEIALSERQKEIDANGRALNKLKADFEKSRAQMEAGVKAGIDEYDKKIVSNEALLRAVREREAIAASIEARVEESGIKLGLIQEDISKEKKELENRVRIFEKAKGDYEAAKISLDGERTAIRREAEVLKLNRESYESKKQELQELIAAKETLTKQADISIAKLQEETEKSLQVLREQQRLSKTNTEIITKIAERENKAKAWEMALRNKQSELDKREDNLKKAEAQVA